MSVKVIAVVGDSHTWGEGVGAEAGFSPAVCCGDLRPLSLTAPCYVGILRDVLDRTSGSSCSEYEGAALAALCGRALDPCGGVSVSRGETVVLAEDFALARVFFLANDKAAEAVLTVGDVCVTEALHSGVPTMNACVKVAHIRTSRGAASGGLRVACVAGERVMIHRVELYRGEYAVVNCGIGSCPVGLYSEAYFARYVESLAPHAILFEGCTINDWLRTPSAEAYGADLRRMLARQRALTARVLWHTVTPIGGSPVSGQGTVYGDYVNAMRAVAAEEGVEIVDCNREMEAILNALPEEERAPYFFHDIWHPNGEGHRLYARMLLPRLQAILR